MSSKDSGLVEATTNLILLATVVLIGTLLATTVVGVSLKYLDFGRDNLGEFSETGVRSPGLIAYGFNIDVANSSFSGERSEDVILTGQGHTGIWDETFKDWGKGSPEGFPPDFFSILLAGYIWCPTNTNVTLHVNTGGIAWVWVDNEPLLSTLTPVSSLSLSQGYHSLKVKYVALGADTNASFELLWDMTGQMTPLEKGDIFY